MPHFHSPIQAWHLAHQAALTPVAGWEMPLHFALGTQAEHLHTRTKAGLFDFSHMGKFLLEGNGATAALSRCVTANLATLKPGRCRYGFLLNDAGGIQDDLIVYRLEDEKYLLVLNPENTPAKFAELQSAMPAPLALHNNTESTAKIDLQGPQAFTVLEAVLPGPWRRLPFYGFTTATFEGAPLIISRTGYTGELGVELYCPNEKALALWECLIAHEAVAPVGLGARDTLRLEAGLPLAGRDLDAQHTPAEAGFAGLLTSQAAYKGHQGAYEVRQRLTPLSFSGPHFANCGSAVHSLDGENIGHITSSIVSPSLGHGIAFAYILATHAQNKEFAVETTTGSQPALRASLPFYTLGTARKTLL